jgi:hypothetical protein
MWNFMQCMKVSRVLLLEYSRCQRNTLGWDKMRGQRGIIMTNGDKPFLFVLKICNAEGALSYKKIPLLIVGNLSNI